MIAHSQIMKVVLRPVPSKRVRLDGTEVAAAIGQVNKLPPTRHNVLGAAQPRSTVVHVPSASNVGCSLRLFAPSPQVSQ